MVSIDEAYHNLGSAIVLRAVKDYLNAIKDDDEQVMIECEKFFNSKLYAICTPLSDHNITKTLRIKAEWFIKESKYAFKNLPVSKKDPHNKQHYLEETSVFKCPICGGKVYMYLGRYRCTYPLNNPRVMRGLVCKCSNCLYFLRDVKQEVTMDA